MSLSSAVCWLLSARHLLRRSPIRLRANQAIAKESGATFINVRMGAVQQKWVGEGEKMVAAIFRCCMLSGAWHRACREHLLRGHVVRFAIWVAWCMHWCVIGALRRAIL